MWQTAADDCWQPSWPLSSTVGFNGFDGMFTVFLAWLWRTMRCGYRLVADAHSVTTVDLSGWQPLQIAVRLHSPQRYAGDQGGHGPPGMMLCRVPISTRCSLERPALAMRRVLRRLS